MPKSKVEIVYLRFLRKGYSPDRALHLANLWQKWYGRTQRKSRRTKKGDP